MPQFDVSTFSSQLFWLVLVFGFLYIVVSNVIAPKAESILTARNRYLEDNIGASQEFNDQAKSLRELKDAKLQELNAEAENIRHEAITALEGYFVKKKEELSLVLSEKAQKSQVEIGEYVNSFHVSEFDSCLDLASFIIEKITDKPADLKLLKKIHQEK